MLNSKPLTSQNSLIQQIMAGQSNSFQDQFTTLLKEGKENVILDAINWLSNSQDSFAASFFIDLMFILRLNEHAEFAKKHGAKIVLASLKQLNRMYACSTGLLKRASANPESIKKLAEAICNFSNIPFKMSLFDPQDIFKNLPENNDSKNFECMRQVRLNISYALLTSSLPQKLKQELISFLLNTLTLELNQLGSTDFQSDTKSLSYFYLKCDKKSKNRQEECLQLIRNILTQQFDNITSLIITNTWKNLVSGNGFNALLAQKKHQKIELSDYETDIRTLLREHLGRLNQEEILGILTSACKYLNEIHETCELSEYWISAMVIKTILSHKKAAALISQKHLDGYFSGYSDKNLFVVTLISSGNIIYPQEAIITEYLDRLLTQQLISIKSHPLLLKKIYPAQGLWDFVQIVVTNEKMQFKEEQLQNWMNILLQSIAFMKEDGTERRLSFTITTKNRWVLTDYTIELIIASDKLPLAKLMWAILRDDVKKEILTPKKIKGFFCYAAEKRAYKTLQWLIDTYSSSVQLEPEFLTNHYVTSLVQTANDKEAGDFILGALKKPETFTVFKNTDEKISIVTTAYKKVMSSAMFYNHDIFVMQLWDYRKELQLKLTKDDLENFVYEDITSNNTNIALTQSIFADPNYLDEDKKQWAWSALNKAAMVCNVHAINWFFSKPLLNAELNRVALQRAIWLAIDNGYPSLLHTLYKGLHKGLHQKLLIDSSQVDVIDFYLTLDELTPTFWDRFLKITTTTEPFMAIALLNHKRTKFSEKELLDILNIANEKALCYELLEPALNKLLQQGMLFKALDIFAKAKKATSLQFYILVKYREMIYLPEGITSFASCTTSTSPTFFKAQDSLSAFNETQKQVWMKFKEYFFCHNNAKTIGQNPDLLTHLKKEEKQNIENWLEALKNYVSSTADDLLSSNLKELNKLLELEQPALQEQESQLLKKANY